MSKFLIIYETFEGQTAKIADFISRELLNKGGSVDSYQAKNFPKDLSLAKYDGFIIGAPVRYSGYPSSIRKWIRQNVSYLGGRPSAFFSVCLGIVQKNNVKAQNQERNIVERFLSTSGWKPHIWTVFGGALQYSKYGWFERNIMKYFAGKSHGDTDTTKDYEYTNWEDVKHFVHDFESHIVGKTPAWEGGLKTQLDIAPKHDTPTVNIG